eukprot:gene23263-biopygen22302
MRSSCPDSFPQAEQQGSCIPAAYSSRRENRLGARPARVRFFHFSRAGRTRCRSPRTVTAAVAAARPAHTYYLITIARGTAEGTAGRVPKLLLTWSPDECTQFVLTAVEVSSPATLHTKAPRSDQTHYSARSRVATGSPVAATPPPTKKSSPSAVASAAAAALVGAEMGGMVIAEADGVVPTASGGLRHSYRVFCQNNVGTHLRTRGSAKIQRGGGHHTPRRVEQSTVQYLAMIMARGAKSMSPRGHVQQRLPEWRAWQVQGGGHLQSGVQPGPRLEAPGAGTLRGLRRVRRRPPASARVARGGAPATRQFPPTRYCTLKSVGPAGAVARAAQRGQLPPPARQPPPPLLGVQRQGGHISNPPAPSAPFYHCQGAFGAMWGNSGKNAIVCSQIMVGRIAHRTVWIDEPQQQKKWKAASAYKCKESLRRRIFRGACGAALHPFSWILVRNIGKWETRDNFGGD